MQISGIKTYKQLCFFSLITFFKNDSIIKLYTNDAKSKLVETTYDKFDKESKPPPKIYEILPIKQVKRFIQCPTLVFLPKSHLEK